MNQKDIDETDRYLKSNNHDEEMLYSGVVRKEEGKGVQTNSLSQSTVGKEKKKKGVKDFNNNNKQQQ